MSAALRMLLLLAAGLFLAPVPAFAHVFPENRVRGVSDYPSGQNVETLPLSQQTATGCASWATETASGRAEWISRDPIGVAGGVNLYGYAGDDPVNSVDPTGTIAGVDDGAEIDGALVGAAATAAVSAWEAHVIAENSGTDLNNLLSTLAAKQAVGLMTKCAEMANHGERKMQGRDPNPWKGYQPKDPNDPSKGGVKRDPQTGQKKSVPRPSGPPPPNHPNW